MDWWEIASAAPLPITLTPLSTFRAEHVRSEPCAVGRVLHRDRWARILFAGDTATARIPGRSRSARPVDLAAAPDRAYEPRWFMKDIQ